jgi:hypothetical protein
MTLEDLRSHVETNGPCRIRSVALEKTGTLHRVGTGSAIVQWDGTRTKRFFDKQAQQTVTFEEPTEKPGPVCLGLEVEVLDTRVTERNPRAGDGRGSQGRLAKPLPRTRTSPAKPRAGGRRKPHHRRKGGR